MVVLLFQQYNYYDGRQDQRLQTLASIVCNGTIHTSRVNFAVMKEIKES